MSKEKFDFDKDSEYIQFGSMEQDTYMQIPRWLMKPKYNKISVIAKMIYVLILDTCKLSYSNFKNGMNDNFEFWDYHKNVPRCKISYPIFMDKLGLGSRSTVNKHIDLLVDLNLIERKRNYDNTNYYYVKKYVEEIQDVYISDVNFDRDTAILNIKEYQEKKNLQRSHSESSIN